jgi:SAM-dependent methyltransferase
MSTGLVAWHFICPSCDTETSNLQAGIEDISLQAAVDESARENGLRELRKSNFKIILDYLAESRPEIFKENLLDVGSAHGWFVELATKRFSKVVGIEPDSRMVDRALSNGTLLRTGYFPDCLGDSELFDVIIFNDVFEHIPHPANTLASVFQHMNDGGMLVLNLPVVSGFFYRISKLLARIGFLKPFERMWQKDMPSPHLYYFSKLGLIKLSERSGFAAANNMSLPTIRLAGLYSRIALAQSGNRIFNITVWLLVASCLPVLWMLPADTKVFFYKK